MAIVVATSKCMCIYIYIYILVVLYICVYIHIYIHTYHISEAYERAVADHVGRETVALAEPG